MRTDYIRQETPSLPRDTQEFVKILERAQFDRSSGVVKLNAETFPLKDFVSRITAFRSEASPLRYHAAAQKYAKWIEESGKKSAYTKSLCVKIFEQFLCCACQDCWTCTPACEESAILYHAQLNAAQYIQLHCTWD